MVPVGLVLAVMLIDKGFQGKSAQSIMGATEKRRDGSGRGVAGVAA